MGGSARKARPRPSYEEGELRDKSIEKKMDPLFTREDFKRLASRAVKKQPKAAPTA